jgi:LEA14-like dessication related protein
LLNDPLLTENGLILRIINCPSIYSTIKNLMRMKKIIFTLLIGVVALSACRTGNVKEPEFRDISNVRLIDVGILQSTAGVDLIYYNPNSFGVQLSEARGDVYIDGAYLGRFSLEDKVQVGKRSEFVVPAVIKVDMIGAIKNQRELLKKKEVNVRIDGIARVNKAGFSKEIPIRYDRMENIERFRSLVSIK